MDQLAWSFVMPAALAHLHSWRTLMITNRKWPLRAAATLLLSVVLAGCAAGPAAHSAQLHQQIDSASTRAQHEALATRYDREAASARANAAEHRSRALKYPASTDPRDPPILRAHWNLIAQKFDAIATEYDGLAAEHRGLAGQAKP